MLPEGQEERFAQLRRRPKLRRELRADREAAVETVEFGTHPALWIPLVPLDPPRNEPPPRRVAAPGARDLLAGLDSQGRAVLVRGAFGAGGEEPRAIVAHPGEFPEVDDGHVGINALVLMWEGPRLEVVNFQTADGVAEVWWIDHDDAGRPVRFAKRQDFDRILVAECAWDGDRCVRVQRRETDGGRRWHHEIREAEYDDEGLLRIHRHLDATAARDHALPPVSVGWDRERDAPLEDPLPVEAALEAWVDWLAGAVKDRLPAEAALARVGTDWESLPSLEWATTAAFAAVRARAQAPYDILRAFEHEVELGPAPSIVLRSLRQQEIPSYDPRREVAARDLQAALAGHRVLVTGVDHDELAALLDPQPAPGPAVPGRLPADPEELRELLEAHELPAQLAGQARWAYGLERGGRGRSRLGGRPRLPEGMAWPRPPGGRLTHLCTIDFAELPAMDGREQLPGDGLMIILAGLTEEHELWERTAVGDDDRVVVLHVAPDAPLVEPEGRSTPSLRERRVSFVPLLTLPEEPVGLDAAQRVAYERLYEALEAHYPRHRMLGHATSVQGTSPPADHVCLLYMGWDEKLGFEFLDGGDLTFHGPAADVAAARFDSLTLDVETL